MISKGKVAIRGSRKQVWNFLTNLSQIGQSLAGVQNLEISEPNQKYH